MFTRLRVGVSFVGTVDVYVPAELPAANKLVLARVMALSKVLATTDNPDSPDDEALEDYLLQCDVDESVAERHYDDSRVGDVSGSWMASGSNQVIDDVD